jgi:hypothetical protein
MQHDRKLVNSRRLTLALVAAVALALIVAVAPVQADAADGSWGDSSSVSTGAGPVSIDPNLAQTDISFVGAVDYIPTAFGFGGPAPPGG